MIDSRAPRFNQATIGLLSLQPVFGEGALEDSRPPRFANMVGAVFL